MFASICKFFMNLRSGDVLIQVRWEVKHQTALFPETPIISKVTEFLYGYQISCPSRTFLLKKGTVTVAALNTFSVSKICATKLNFHNGVDIFPTCSSFLAIFFR